MENLLPGNVNLPYFIAEHDKIQVVLTTNFNVNGTVSVVNNVKNLSPKSLIYVGYQPCFGSL